MTAVAPQSVVPRPFPPVKLPRGSRFLGYLSTTDPKVLGVMYIDTSIMFFMVGGLLALLMRAELARPDFPSQSFGRYPFSAAGGIVDDLAVVGFALEIQTRPIYS